MNENCLSLLCTTCGALFAGGRWSWQTAPAGSHTIVCPACQRIADDYQAGNLVIKGSFF